MSYKTIQVNPLELYLDEKNPRFVTKNTKNLNQEKIREYLIEYEDVIQLAGDINGYGGLVAGERLLIIKENGRYKVLEGNRRTTAMQILMDSNNIPTSVSDPKRRKIPKITEECLTSIGSIEVDLLSNRDEALYALAKRHIDGIKKWSQISKIYFYRNQFDQGKKLKEMKSYTGESEATIRKNLKQYSFLRFILDNYYKFFTESNIAKLEIETELKTDFIVSRLYSYAYDEFNLKFNKKYDLSFASFSKVQKDLITELLVKMSYLYWGEDGDTASAEIDSRSLNTQQQVKNYFANPTDNSHKMTHQISNLIHKFKDSVKETTTEDSNDYDEQGEQDEEGIDAEFNGTDEQDEDRDEGFDGTGQQDENVDDESHGVGQQDGVEDKSNGLSHQAGGYRPRDPVNYKFLTKAYKLTNHYKRNSRINKIKSELDKLEYKDLTISSMFLMRSILDSYVINYIDFFSGLEKDNPLKIKSLSSRSKRELQDLIYNFIKEHIKKNFKEEETINLIEVAFSKNNNTSTTKILNYYIHSSQDFPDKHEILDAWKKISSIINTLDKLLADYGGQS